MKIHKSIVLTALLPFSDLDELKKCVDSFRSVGVDTFEYYLPECDALELGKYLREKSLRGIYLIAAFQKKNGIGLADVEEETRREHVDVVKKLIDTAYECGSFAALITSGKRPESPSLDERAWSNLEKSIRELLEYNKGRVKLFLEPGDIDVDSCQLAGHTDDCAAMAERIQRDYSEFGLTMDTSHIAQLGENVEEALKKTNEYSIHTHLANCILKRGHPLYGDKHPGLNHPDGVFDSQQLKEYYEFAIEEKKRHPEITVSIEVILRKKEVLTEIVSGLVVDAIWFFENKNKKR